MEVLEMWSLKVFCLKMWSVTAWDIGFPFQGQSKETN